MHYCFFFVSAKNDFHFQNDDGNKKYVKSQSCLKKIICPSLSLFLSQAHTQNNITSVCLYHAHTFCFSLRHTQTLPFSITLPLSLSIYIIHSHKVILHLSVFLIYTLSVCQTLSLFLTHAHTNNEHMSVSLCFSVYLCSLFISP